MVDALNPVYGLGIANLAQVALRRGQIGMPENDLANDIKWRTSPRSIGGSMESQVVWAEINAARSSRLLDSRSCPCVPNGSTSILLPITPDITKRKQLEQKLREMSLYDSLTGLYNRNFFEEEMERFSDGRHNPLGIIVCDLDGLKFINDTLGHQAGDKMLINIAEILRQNFRSSDIVARIGGDEFAVLLSETDPEVVELMLQRVRQLVQVSKSIEQEVPLSLSIGHVLGEGEAADMHALFREADNQIYREKIQHSGSTHGAILQGITKTMQARDFDI